MTGVKGWKLLVLPVLLLVASAGAKLFGQSDSTTQSNPAPRVAQNAPSDDESNASISSGDQLRALPIPGRNWQEVLLDSPATGDAQRSDAETPSRNNGHAATITFDGVPTRLAFGITGTRRNAGGSLLGSAAAETAIRAVRVLDADAAFPGSHANVETQRGTGTLHGHASLFDRESLWGAQNPFTQWVKQTAPGTLVGVPVFTPQPYTASDREIMWGGGAGGSIRPRRIFWFAALESKFRDDPGVSTVKHPDSFFAQPSNDQMQVLSARLGLSSANPVAAGVSAYSGMLQTLDGLLGPAARRSTQWNGLGRIDWDASEHNHFTIEGTGAHLDAPGGGLTRASEAYGTHSFGANRVSDQLLLARWQASVTPNLLSVTQGSLRRHIFSMPAGTPSAWEQTLNVNSWGRLPQIIVDSGYGFTIGNPSRFGPGSYPDEHFYQAGQQLEWAHGVLLVRAGIDASHNKDATSRLRNQTGTYHYSSVENFASDALAFAAFGINGQLNPFDQHNCDQTGKVWRDSAGTLHGLGYLPCYSYYSQTMGPTDWEIATTDWASYITSQWQLKKQLVLSAGLRWELEQMPSPISMVDNPDLPLTEKLPGLGGEWGPRASLAWGSSKGRGPALRLGYGMYFARTPNATLETALTHTGSLKGDLNFFMRPTDNLNAGGAPPFPYVLAGEPGSIVKPGAVEFAPMFRNGEVHQGVVSLEQPLPGRIRLEASGVVILGRRLPVTLDANIDPASNPKTITYAVVDGNHSGPIKTAQVTVPFFASWPSLLSTSGGAGRLNANYQQVTEIFSRANSTYEAAIVRLTRNSRSGLTLHARYTYAHAMDWNPNESASVAGPSVLDPTDFGQEYGTGNLDVRHSGTAAVIWEPRWKLHEWRGPIGNGWMISAIGYAHSGLPYTMRTAGSLAKEFTTSGSAIVGLAPGMNGYGGAERVYGVGRNTYRYPGTWKTDMRLAKRFSLGSERQLELLAESFNLFNHQNTTQLETVGYTIESGSTNGALPRLNFLTGLKSGQKEFGQPLDVNATDNYRERQIQFGVGMRF